MNRRNGLANLIGETIADVDIDQDGKVERRYSPDFAKYIGKFKSLKDQRL